LFGCVLSAFATFLAGIFTKQYFTEFDLISQKVSAMLTARAVAVQAVVSKPRRAQSTTKRVLVRVGKIHAAGEVFPGECIAL
jgi:hypothetical protein